MFYCGVACTLKPTKCTLCVTGLPGAFNAPVTLLTTVYQVRSFILNTAVVRSCNRTICMPANGRTIENKDGRILSPLSSYSPHYSPIPRGLVDGDLEQLPRREGMWRAHSALT